MSNSQPTKAPSQPVHRIAIAPGSGVFGDAISVEMFNLGYQVIDANEALTLLAREGLEEYEITTSRGYGALKKKGINAVLVAKAVSGFDGTPESASVRVTDTNTGAVIAAVTWQNGWGGMRGSIADRVMRKNLSEVATDVAKELDERLK
jgi:hypothetical protein